MHSITVLSTRSGMLAGRKAYKAMDEDMASSATYYAIYHMVSMSFNINYDDTGNLCRVQKGRLQLLFGVVNELLAVLEMDVRLSEDTTACISQKILQEISRMPVATSLNGKLPLDEMSSVYVQVMQQLWDRLRASEVYFGSKQIVLIHSSPQITALLRGDFVGSTFPNMEANTKPCGVDGKIIANENSNLDEISALVDFQQQMSTMQYVRLVLRKYTRCLWTPCCTNTKGIVAPLSPDINDAHEATNIQALKPRFTCRYMQPRDGSFVSRNVSAEDTAASGSLGSSMHAPTLTKDIICALSDYLVACAGTTPQGPAREYTRFVYNSSTKRVRYPNGGIEVANSLKEAFADEVRSATAVQNNPGTSKVQHGSDSFASGYVLNTHLKSNGKEYGANKSSIARATSSGPPPSPVRSLQADPHDLEVLFFSDTGIMLVCESVVTMAVESATMHDRSGIYTDIDVESQHLLDFLIMADSCLQHTLIHSVRELPID